ncbi:hypothetical protein CTEN210_08770 [Chaetoceros tenuissimus]|uniref:Leucine-rich repeat domain-containing protein n=1 Tax=Chaetoceros tenuissimus TaxID=426638 RepID=A0AAD3H712_9STRA|nr:hypothetical protein CTEN210_08770 [Chaetoceros tenuissimus]
MRVATVDGLVTLFYDGSKELFDLELVEEWLDERYNQLRMSGEEFEESDSETYLTDLGDLESWDLSDGCKRYMRERLSWQQIIIMEGVTEIPEGTFEDCFKVKRVIFTDTVIRIGESAFQDCKSLVYIKLSINLEVIVQYTFQFCDLSSVFIPPSCRSIGVYAFRYNKNLKIFNVPQETDLEDWSVIAGTKLFKK